MKAPRLRFTTSLFTGLWPHIGYTRTIALTSATLCSVVAREHLNMEDYDALVLDTQGSELLVLRAPRASCPASGTFRWRRRTLKPMRDAAGFRKWTVSCASTASAGC